MVVGFVVDVEGFETAGAGRVLHFVDWSFCKDEVLNCASSSFVKTFIFILCAVRYKAFCSEVQYSNCPVYIKL